MPIDTNALRQLSPGALDTIKLIALLSMLTDHINTLLLPQMNPCLYAIGRMAFPLFALIWALNVGRYPEPLVFLNEITWLLERPADTLLLATLPTLVFPVAVVAFAEKVFPSGTRRFMSGQFFYLAYAGHLAFLGILAKLY
jgi:hypothetical protein